LLRVATTSAVVGRSLRRAAHDVRDDRTMFVPESLSPQVPSRFESPPNPLRVSSAIPGTPARELCPARRHHSCAAGCARHPVCWIPVGEARREGHRTPAAPTATPCPL